MTGRVVVTVLHNFATPLVRYELGDYAEAGVDCACGRGLPVLTRIMGRVRNMLVAADGKRYWPTFGSRSLGNIASIRQHQFAQIGRDLIEARLVTSAPLDSHLEEHIRNRVLARLPPGFRLAFAYPARIERGNGGKFEDFICEVPQAKD
jgi:phenylacetate-CoA ligase